MLHPTCVERRSPTSLVVHAALNVTDAAPRVEPRAEGVEYETLGEPLGQVNVEPGGFEPNEEQPRKAISHGQEFAPSFHTS